MPQAMEFELATPITRPFLPRISSPFGMVQASSATAVSHDCVGGWLAGDGACANPRETFPGHRQNITIDAPSPRLLTVLWGAWDENDVACGPGGGPKRCGQHHPNDRTD